MKKETIGLMVRLPHDIKSFVAQQSDRNGSSQNSEIIRAVRERMERVQREEMPAPAGQ
ncbi:Arc family DNA-binding protein [Shinella zoogloeoides]|uniref:Arc family DNA-binding protein n=1 Tax=Shinella zoogloeoides TaxID=352475 RepID=UPI0028AB19C6|nr:Arc family DNA-binding protein [Shinella zoogloeoides]